MGGGAQDLLRTPVRVRRRCGVAGATADVRRETDALILSKPRQGRKEKDSKRTRNGRSEERTRRHRVWSDDSPQEKVERVFWVLVPS